DRVVATADWLGRHFRLIDTGGFEVEAGAGLAARLREQSLKGGAGAGLAPFPGGGPAGLPPHGVPARPPLAQRRVSRVCPAHTIDGAKQEEVVYEFFGLGLGDPIGVSAENSRSIDELLDRVIAALPAGGQEKQAEPALRVAIVGRPNVGKSSILNRLLGEER